MPTIVFNGKSYNSLQDMSPQERQAYEQLTNMFMDKNGNGIPDFLEGDIVKNISTFYNAASTINFNGAAYNNLNELPPDVQEKVKTAFNKISGMGMVPQNSDEDHGTEHHIHNDEYVQSTKFVSREYKPVIEEEKGTNPLLWLLIGVSAAVCIGAAAVIFLLM